MIPPLEYQILSTVICSKLLTKGSGRIVIAQQPSKDFHFRDISVFEKAGVFNSFSGLSVSTVESLLSQESEVEVFEPNFEIPREFTLLPKAEATRIFEGKANWKRFYEEFPDSPGIFYLSRVGFDTACSRALLHFGNQWGGRAGHGMLVYLGLHAGKMEIIGEERTWVS